MGGTCRICGERQCVHMQQRSSGLCWNGQHAHCPHQLTRDIMCVCDCHGVEQVSDEAWSDVEDSLRRMLGRVRGA